MGSKEIYYKDGAGINCGRSTKITMSMKIMVGFILEPPGRMQVWEQLHGISKISKVF